MQDLKVELNITPDVKEDIDEAEFEVGRILSEIKDELLSSSGPDGKGVELTLSAAVRENK